jgi:uncharacterized membrane protein YfcA
LGWYIYLLVMGAGFLCGFINTLAGSGSLITLPLLIFLGLPANVANGTNRIAILFQNIVGAGSFHRQRLLDLPRGYLLSAPAVAGSVLGAQIAINLSESVMRQTIGVLMVVMLIVILIRPQLWLEGRPGIVARRPGWVQMLIFFMIGIYGGFIQAGVGFFLLAGLVLGAGYDLVRANALKVFIIMCYTVFALIVFGANNQVHWQIGFILALGSMAGAWIASLMAGKLGARFVRWFLLAIMLVSAIVLLDLINFLRRCF